MNEFVHKSLQGLCHQYILMYAFTFIHVYGSKGLD
jgi:hypothetical protein